MKIKKYRFIIAALIAAFAMSAFAACSNSADTDTPVTPGADGLVSVVVFRQPSKTEYYIGDVFDPSGMVLKANYDDGRTVNLLYENCTYNTEPLAAEDTEVVITFGSQSATVPVRVIVRPTGAAVTGISLVTLPAKTEYVRGEVFNPAGAVVKATYADSSSFEVSVSELEYSRNPLTVEDTQIVLSYGGFDVVVEITVSRYALRIECDENKTYRMEAEATDLSTIALTGWAAGKDIVERSSAASAGAFLANLSAAKGYVEYGVYSAVESKVTLYITCALGAQGGTMNMDEAFAATWNGETFITGATLEGTTWSDFQKIKLGTVKLNEGDNTLRLTRRGTCPNFDCVDFDVNNPDDEIPVTLSGLTLVSGPAKTDYYVGETFDPAGMVVKATYSDGSEKNVPIAELIYKTSPLTDADTQVTVGYRDASVTVTLTVSEPDVTGITVEKTPARTTYVRGETFDPSGMIVVADCKNGKTFVVPLAELTFDKTPLAETDVQVTVSYKNFTATVAVTVSKYSIKIGRDEHQTYRMEAEAADLSHLTSKSPSVTSFIDENPQASGKVQLGKFWAGSGYIEYGIYSEVETKVTLFIYVATAVDNLKADNAFAMTWNGSALITGADIPNKGWQTIQKTELACVPVVKGENTLRLTLKSNCPNFDCVDFEVNNPDDEINGGCVIFGAANTSKTAEAENCAVAGTPANGKTEFTENEGNYLCCLGKNGNTVTVVLYAETDMTVDLSMLSGHNYTNDIYFQDTFIATLNGASVTLTAKLSKSGWKSFTEAALGSIQLKAGINTLVLTVKAAQVPNIDKFVFTKAQ